MTVSKPLISGSKGFAAIISSDPKTDDDVITLSVDQIQELIGREGSTVAVTSKGVRVRIEMLRYDTSGSMRT